VRVEVQGHINCAVVRSALEPSDVYRNRKNGKEQLKMTGGGEGWERTGKDIRGEGKARLVKEWGGGRRGKLNEAESRVTQRLERGGGGLAVGGVVAEAREMAMVAPERHWRMQRTFSQRQDEGGTVCRLDQLRAPSWAFLRVRSSLVGHLKRTNVCSIRAVLRLNACSFPSYDDPGHDWPTICDDD